MATEIDSEHGVHNLEVLLKNIMRFADWIRNGEMGRLEFINIEEL